MIFTDGRENEGKNYIEIAACGFSGISKFGKNIYLRRNLFLQMEPKTIVVRMWCRKSTIFYVQKRNFFPVEVSCNEVFLEKCLRILL